MASQKKTPAKRPAVGMQNYGSIDPQFSTMVLKCQMEIAKMGNEKPKTVEELVTKIEQYFEIVAKYHLPPTVEGLRISFKLP